MTARLPIVCETESDWAARTAAQCARVSAKIDAERNLEPYELVRKIKALADIANYQSRYEPLMRELAHDLYTVADVYADIGERIAQRESE